MQINPANINRLAHLQREMLQNSNPAKGRKGQAVGSDIGSSYARTIQMANSMKQADPASVTYAKHLVDNGQLETRENITATARKILTVGL